MRRRTPESYVLKAITDYLTAERILWFRMNTGQVVAERNGKKRAFRFGYPGMADLICWPNSATTCWIEAKCEKGKQTEQQRQFEETVWLAGHLYLLARSVDDVRDVFESFRRSS